MKNNDDIKKLLEAFDRTEQWRGEDPNPPNGKLVGESDKFLGGHFNSDDQVREEEGVAGAERNREMGHAKIDLIQGREGEQRRVWQQHYDRAIRNGRDRAQARRYADSMTGSEAVFNGDDNEITEREAGAGYGDNTQRGTPPWMMPGSDGGDGNDGKKTSFQLAGDDEEENVFDEAASVAPDIATPTRSKEEIIAAMDPKTRAMMRKRKIAQLAADDAAASTQLPPGQQQQPGAQQPRLNSSKDYNDVTMLEAKLMKAYEDYVGDPYSENNVIPKKANKRPGKDVPKAKKAKRQPEPNELAEMFPNRDSGSTDAENKAWERNFKKVQAAKKKAQAAKAKKPTPSKVDEASVKGEVKTETDAKKGIADLASKISNTVGNLRTAKAKTGQLQAKFAKKEKPFKDAAATGNPRDFANESGPKKKSENRELWDRINKRGTTRGVDTERYGPRDGLDGPIPQKNGKVLYYDPKNGVDRKGQYYDPDTDFYVSDADYAAMNEGDPDIPHDVHVRNKEKDREAFQRNFARGQGERTKKAVDACVQQFMKRPVKSDPAAVGESSGRFAQLAHLRAKFESVSSKLKELKGQRALKEAPINQVVAPVGTPQQQQQQQTTATGQPAVKPQPINTAQSPAQQAPVQAPAGTPTAVPAPGQPAPPAAGQPGGAPVQAPGTPAPPGQGATNAATTPGEQMKGFVQSLSNNPAGAKQLATKLNTVR